MNKINPNNIPSGYRILRPGSKVRKNKDYYTYHNQVCRDLNIWTSSGDWGIFNETNEYGLKPSAFTVITNRPKRIRKTNLNKAKPFTPEIPDGWEVIQEGETLIKGDKYFSVINAGSQWREINCALGNKCDYDGWTYPPIRKTYVPPDNSIDLTNYDINWLISKITTGDFVNKAFHLSNVRNWELKKDNKEGWVLIPTNKS